MDSQSFRNPYLAASNISTAAPSLLHKESTSLQDLSAQAVCNIVQTLPEHLLESVIGKTTTVLRQRALKQGLAVVEKHLDLVLQDMIASGLGGLRRTYSIPRVTAEETFEYELAEEMAYGLYELFVRGIEKYHRVPRNTRKRKSLCSDDESSESD